MSYGLFGKFITNEGKRDELANILIQASEILKDNKNCLQYIISTSKSQNEVFVSEIWIDEKSHDESLNNQDLLNLIIQAKPLIKEIPESQKLSILGGKGI